MLIKVILPSQLVISVDLSPETTVASLLDYVCRLRSFDEKWPSPNRLQLWESVLIQPISASSSPTDYQDISRSEHAAQRICDPSAQLGSFRYPQFTIRIIPENDKGKP
jgi:hypothetical protein